MDPQVAELHYCVVDKLIFVVFVVFIIFFLAFIYELYVSNKIKIFIPSSRLSVTHTTCSHFHFSISRPGKGGI